MDQYTLTMYRLQEHAARDLARELETRRRMAERSSAADPSVPGTRAAVTVWTRLFHHAAVRSRPV
ncbi:hypothetical protein G5T42_13670 [Microbacterium sp. 4R-513]|uniref:hypothetical protein n=1 Tax=Microbacterium sp. 4R-513 TaxID=2567934 RepID=UPI0013E1CEA5|nr:hypothetical protein [Microbacterium sp. 4R-513]QIG40393.1 hypothetical protein G5T42_13670 [Microbacterium sp. 4R-513]